MPDIKCINNTATLTTVVYQRIFLENVSVKTFKNWQYSTDDKSFVANF